jgi:sugar/nucleoside kinase (ribokinase family)
VAGPLVCTLGDLLLDVVVRVDGPIAVDTDTYGRTRVGAGGQAANVAAWVVRLGGRGRFIGKRASDPAGRILVEELAGRGVDVVGPQVAAGTGTVVSLAASDGTRAMLSDRGVASLFAPDELDGEWLAGCDVLHVPGYSLVAEPLAASALAAAALAPRISLDLSSIAAIRSIGADRFREQIARLRPEIVFATEAEAELVGRVEADTVVVKRGAAGCLVRSGAGEETFAARSTEVVDATGAGDAFAAGFLLGGPELALDAAARCVATMGAMP